MYNTLVSYIYIMARLITPFKHIFLNLSTHIKIKVTCEGRFGVKYVFTISEQRMQKVCKNLLGLEVM